MKYLHDLYEYSSCPPNPPPLPPKLSLIYPVADPLLQSCERQRGGWGGEPHNLIAVLLGERGREREKEIAREREAETERAREIERGGVESLPLCEDAPQDQVMEEAPVPFPLLSRGQA